MMKVLRPSRKLSVFDGARNASLRPAKQISPLGKIWAIWIPVLPVLPAVLPVLLLPLEIPMLAKIPNSLKYFFFKSKYKIRYLFQQFYLHVPFSLRNLDVARRTGLDRNGQESMWQVVNHCPCPLIIRRSHGKRCQERRSQKPNYDFSTYNHLGSGDKWSFLEDALRFYTLHCYF